MRIILLLIVLTALVVFAIQNLSPVPLVFLGTTTQALPLAVWVLGAIASGLIASLLLQFLNYLTQRQLQARLDRLEAVKQVDGEQRYESSSPPPRSSQTQETESNSDDYSDWVDEEPESEEDEDWEDETEDSTPQTPRDAARESTNYEVRQEPKTSNRTGSVYSYSYREPRNSGVGRTEAVYDAEYRVITPPYRDPSRDEDNYQPPTREEDDYQPPTRDRYRDDWESKRDDDWDF